MSKWGCCVVQPHLDTLDKILGALHERDGEQFQLVREHRIGIFGYVDFVSNSYKRRVFVLTNPINPKLRGVSIQR